MTRVAAAARIGQCITWGNKVVSLPGPQAPMRCWKGRRGADRLTFVKHVLSLCGSRSRAGGGHARSS